MVKPNFSHLGNFQPALLGNFRPALTTLLGDSRPNANVWYGYSTDASGSQWVFGNKGKAVFSSGAADWDYPSIGVDATGRVIIGAVLFPCSSCTAFGYNASVSADGETFGNNFLVTDTAGDNPGDQSRVVAAGKCSRRSFPLSVRVPRTRPRRSTATRADGVNWSTIPFLVENFGPPLNDATPSGSTRPVFYAPLLSAGGYTDGRWAVAWQRNNGGWNNFEICTSDRGCGTVNAAADDEFLGGVSVSADGYWVSYHTYPAAGSRQLPLMIQAIYFPTGGNAVGADINPCGPGSPPCGVYPTAWAVAETGQSPPARCSAPCYASGDYNTPASNPFAGSLTSYVQQSPRIDDLFQSFLQDPQAAPNVPNFVPNFVYHPLGADLRPEGLPVPAESQGLPAQLARGFKTRF